MSTFISVFRPLVGSQERKGKVQNRKLDGRCFSGALVRIEHSRFVNLKLYDTFGSFPTCLKPFLHKRHKSRETGGVLPARVHRAVKRHAYTYSLRPPPTFNFSLVVSTFIEDMRRMRNDAVFLNHMPRPLTAALGACTRSFPLDPSQSINHAYNFSVPSCPVRCDSLTSPLSFQAG